MQIESVLTNGAGCIAIAQLHAIGVNLNTSLISDSNPHFTVFSFPALEGWDSLVRRHGAKRQNAALVLNRWLRLWIAACYSLYLWLPDSVIISLFRRTIPFFHPTLSLFPLTVLLHLPFLLSFPSCSNHLFLLPSLSSSPFICTIRGWHRRSSSVPLF